jgi:hypothetical protein
VTSSFSPTRCELAGSAIGSSSYWLMPWLITRLMSAIVVPNVAWIRKRAASVWLGFVKAVAAARVERREP